MNSNEIYEREISYWKNTSPFYADFFRTDIIIKILDLCEIISSRHPLKEKIIADFISGLALLPIYLKTKDEKQGKLFDKLTKPVIDEINSHVLSEEYRNELMSKHLSDKDLLETLIRKIDVPVLVPNEISRIKLEFNEWIASQHHQIKDKFLQPGGSKSIKLTVKQIALILVYKDKRITRGNASKFAASYGFTKKSSGEGLYQDYCFFSSPANRKGLPTFPSPLKLKNKIRLFESILDHLTEAENKRALDEIQILKTRFDNEYR